MIVQKGFGINSLDEASSFLTTFNNELCADSTILVIPFGATAVGDVFQHKLDECFGKIEQVIIIGDDVMIVGYKPDHSDYMTKP